MSLRPLSLSLEEEEQRFSLEGLLLPIPFFLAKTSPSSSSDVGDRDSWTRREDLSKSGSATLYNTRQRKATCVRSESEPHLSLYVCITALVNAHTQAWRESGNFISTAKGVSSNPEGRKRWGKREREREREEERERERERRERETL